MTSYPIWEYWMTLFVISHSHKSLALHVILCFSASHCDLLSPVSRLTPLFSLLTHTHHDTVCDHMTCHLPIYLCCHRQQVLITKDVAHRALWYHTKVCDHDECRNSLGVFHPTGLRESSTTETAKNRLSNTQVIQYFELIACLYDNTIIYVVAAICRLCFASYFFFGGGCLGIVSLSAERERDSHCDRLCHFELSRSLFHQHAALIVSV